MFIAMPGCNRWTPTGLVSSTAPASPAKAPETASAAPPSAVTRTPACLAASGLRPSMVSRNPQRVRAIAVATTAAAASAISRPPLTCRSGYSPIEPSRALSGSGLDCGATTASPTRVSCSSHGVFTANATSCWATKVISSVLTTTSTPRKRYISELRPAHAPPASAATASTITSSTGPVTARRSPTQAAKRAPTSTWPSCPMLNTPDLALTHAPTATSSSGAAYSRVAVQAVQSAMLPWKRARTDARGDPPVTAISSDDRARATTTPAAVARPVLQPDAPGVRARRASRRRPDGSWPWFPVFPVFPVFPGVSGVSVTRPSRPPACRAVRPWPPRWRGRR